MGVSLSRPSVQRRAVIDKRSRAPFAAGVVARLVFDNTGRNKRQVSDAMANGVIDTSFTSQLTVLTPDEFQSGVARIREAEREAGGELHLIADFRLYATIGWVG